MPNAISDHRLGGFSRWVYQHQAARYGITVLANSRYTAATFGHRPVKPHVVYLGADAAQFDPMVVRPISRAELGIPEDAVVVGIFARVGPDKGQDRVLAAMLPLAGEHNLWLLLVGSRPSDDPFLGALRSKAAAGLVNRLCVIDAVSEPQRYYGAVDIAASATIGPESFGFSVVEAMLMEKPVLAHALGGPAETVLDGVTGWHVAQPTVEAFRAGLERALADRPRWHDMGAAGRTRALGNFSLDRQAREYVELLSKAVGGAPPGQR
jgi:glycosyltransferase involved in cell wall biosynthesis